MADDILSRYLGITDPNQQSAVRQGLLRAGLGMLANSSQPYGVSPLRGIGIGGLEGVQGYQDALAVQERQALFDQQRTLSMIKQRQAARAEEAANQLRSALESGDKRGISSALAGVDPAAAGKLALTPPKGQLDQTLLDALNNPQSPFYDAARNKFLGVKSPEAQAQALQRAISGRAVNTVTLNTEKTLGGKIAEGIGEDVVNAYGMAKTASSQIESSRRIKDALDKGVIAGPGAKYQVFGSQLAQKLGYPTDEAGLVRTRDVIRELAEATLQSRQMLKGQGQVTEMESRMLERARSGDIDSLSVAEIRRIAELNEKLARKAFDRNRQNIKQLQKDPYSAPLLNMMDSVGELPPEVPYTAPDAPAVASPSGGLTPAEQQELDALRKRFRR